MLDAIKAFFETRIKSAGEAGESEHTLHLATAMLLLEVSRADFDVHDDELAVVVELLQGQFAFNDEEAAELVELATRESEESLSLHPFLRLLNENFDAEQKFRVIEDLWQVAYADGRLDKYEEYQVRRIAELLYVSHSDFIRAKHRVLDRRAAQ